HHVLSSYFYSHIRLPPSSPLFPYTTLFRSLLPLRRITGILLSPGSCRSQARTSKPLVRGRFKSSKTYCGIGNLWRSEYSFLPVRSEEHTSELQSLRHLVCRLLLEKKKI